MWEEKMRENKLFYVCKVIFFEIYCILYLEMRFLRNWDLGRYLWVKNMCLYLVFINILNRLENKNKVKFNNNSKE